MQQNLVNSGGLLIVSVLINMYEKLKACQMQLKGKLTNFSKLHKFILFLGRGQGRGIHVLYQHSDCGCLKWRCPKFRLLHKYLQNLATFLSKRATV